MDEEYTQSDISKVVQELMDDPENPMSFAEAVKEAMAQGYRDGGLTIQIQRLAEGGGVGSLMQPKQNRVGLFMGGDPLTGQAKMIYNSMSSYGYDDQTIADALKTQGLLPTSGTTPPGSTPPDSTPPDTGSQTNEGDGEDRNRNADDRTTTTEKLMSEKLRDPNFTFDRPTMADVANEVSSTTTDNRFSNSVGPVPSETILDKLEITDRNRGMEDNENFIDRGNPLNDSRIVSEEQGLVGGIPDRNRGQTISPQVQEVLSAVNRPTMADIAGRKAGTVDRSISIEDLSKPSNIGDFAITGAPDLTNQTGILDAPPSISMAQDPNVEDPFDGKYTPSFEEKKAVEGILAGLVDKVQGYDIKDALKPENLTTALVGSQLGKFLDVPGSVASFALNTLKNQSDARKEKKAIAAEKAKTEARAAQARADKVEKKRKDDIAKRDATAAAKKAASEGRAYDYAGRKGDLSLPANKQGTHTSTISKEKAAYNREALRGQATKTKPTNTNTNTKTKPTTTKQKSLREKLTGYKTQGEFDQAREDKQAQSRADAMIGRINAGKKTRSNPRDAGKTQAQKDAIGRAQTAAAARESNTGMGSCFIAGTKITMADGTLKNIENIKVGDKVKGHKEDNTVIKLDPTLLGERKLYSFNNNKHHFFTSEHPFMTEEGWKSIKPEKTKERDGVELYEQLKGELKVGDKVITNNGPIQITNIDSKEMNKPDMPLYNFNVSNDNSYIADDYVVHNKGCFIKGTLITMADGSTKPVEQVDLGDEVAVGGKVFAVGRFLNTELYDYKGIKVSGSHMVNEDGTWMRVRDTKHGKSLGDGQNTVYVFGSENRRILINDILFTDYFEIEDQEQLLKEEDKFFDNWKTFANNEDRKNVNTLNAS